MQSNNINLSHQWLSTNSHPSSLLFPFHVIFLPSTHLVILKTTRRDASFFEFHKFIIPLWRVPFELSLFSGIISCLYNLYYEKFNNDEKIWEIFRDFKSTIAACVCGWKTEMRSERENVMFAFAQPQSHATRLVVSLSVRTKKGAKTWMWNLQRPKILQTTRNIYLFIFPSQGEERRESFYCFSSHKISFFFVFLSLFSRAIKNKSSEKRIILPFFRRDVCACSLSCRICS